MPNIGGAENGACFSYPLTASSLGDLPPALFITAELDPIRDKGGAYAEALTAAGVATTHERYDSQPHAFFQLSPILDAGKRLLDQAGAAVRKHLA